MVTRISQWVIRIGSLLALILGLGFWTGNLGNLVGLHMTLGLLVVLALWVLSTIYFRLPGANIGLAIGGVAMGLFLLLIGLTQRSLLSNSSHWLIQVLHLIIALGAIGMGEALAGAIRRATPAAAAR